MTAIRLETATFPGGYSPDPGDPGLLIANLTGYVDANGRPAFLSRLERPTVELDRPIFLQFINCRDDKDLQTFLTQFWSEAKVDIASLKGQLATLRGLVDRSFRTTPSHAQRYALNGYLSGARAIDDSLKVELRPVHGGAGVEFAITTSSTYEYMLFEIGTALEAGAQLGRCRRCDRAFLHGPQTGRRSTAKWCGDNCRQAASRSRKKEVLR